MSERTEAPTEGEPSGEPGSFPAPADPEHPESAPGETTVDEPGESDDDATGADTAGAQADGDESGEPAQPEPAPPETESRLDDVTRQLERAAKTYGKRVADIFGDDWMGVGPCPLCSEHFPGLLTPAPPSAEVVAAVRPLIGLPDYSRLSTDTHARRCDACDGNGKTLTGSRMPEYATIRCSECSGTGFRSALDAHRAQLAPNGSSLPPAPTHEDDVPVPAMSEASIEALERMAAAGRAALASL